MQTISWPMSNGEERLSPLTPTWARAKQRGEHWSESWRDVDAALRSIAKRRAALDAEEAEWLLKARDQQIHMYFGLPTFQMYLEHALGCGPKMAQEKVRVAEALGTQPALKGELASGRLPFTAVRELSRVTRPDTVGAWIEAAAGKTLRQVERMVSGRKPGDLPEAPPDPSLIRHTIRFEVSAQTAALFREALRKIRQDAGTHLSDDEVLAQLARAALSSDSGDSGGAPYQIGITTCGACRKTEMHGDGESVEVGPEVLEKAMCDALQIGRVDKGSPERAAHSIPPAIRRLVWHRDRGKCVVLGCRSRIHLEVHHIRYRENGGNHDPANLAVLCGGCHDRVHERRLIIKGRAPDGLTFLYADGRRLEAPLPAELARPDAGTRQDAVSALVNLSYPRKKARAAVSAAAAHVGEKATVEELVKEALRTIGRN